VQCINVKTKGEVRDQIAGGYIRGTTGFTTGIIPNNGVRRDAIIWDDSGGETYCRMCGAQTNNNLYYWSEVRGLWNK